MPTHASKENSTPPSSPPKMNKFPCEKEWQRVVLDLEVTHPKVQAMATAVQAFCSRWRRRASDGRLLVLVGNPGCGKTHAAKRAANWARGESFSCFSERFWNHPPSTTFVAWPAMIQNAIRSKEFGCLEDLGTYDFLALDDIGAENDDFKTATDKLCQVLSKRADKFTIITTNIAPAEWPTRFDLRVADRLFRNSVIQDLTVVPSYAIWKRTHK